MEVRVGAAESIALLFERAFGREEDEEEEEDTRSPQSILIAEEGDEFVSPVLRILKSLATECTKHKSKRDKQTQKRGCRAVVDYLETGRSEPVEIRLSVSKETLNLPTWAARRRYSFLRQLLGTGIEKHLKLNTVVRSIFGIFPSLSTLRNYMYILQILLLAARVPFSCFTFI